MSTVKYSAVRVMLLALALAALGALFCAGSSALADDGEGADPGGEGALAAGGLVAQGTETDPDGTGGATGAAYAKFDSGTGTLTFFRSSEEYATNQKETYTDRDGNEQTITYYADIETTDWPGSTSGGPQWRNEYRTLTRVVFEDEIAPISTAAWFYSLFYLESIEGMEKLNTSRVTNMWYMFSHCRKLTELDVSHMNVAQVKRFDAMFQECQSLTQLDLSNFDTSQAENMSSMFNGCIGLTTLDVSYFDTSNVKNMAYMFGSCTALTTLNLSSFDTSQVESMRGMFRYCQMLGSLNLSCFDTSNVTNMEAMFQFCSALTSLNLSGWDTSSVTNMNYMFYGCSGFTGLDLSSFDTSDVVGMKDMFHGCYRLADLDVSSLKTPKVTNMSGMFYNCAGFLTLDLSDLNVSQVKDFSEMFTYCHGLTSIDLTGWDTSKAETMGGMFEECESLVSVNMSNLDTSHVTNFNNLFKGCSSLSNLNLSGIDTSSATGMRYMFHGCSGLTSLDLSGFKTSAVTDMQYMFYGCSSLTALALSGWDTSNVTTMTNMFRGCESLATLDVSDFATSNVTDMSAMFYECKGLASLDLSGFNTSNVTSMGSMFYGCQFTALDLSGFDTSKVVYMAQMFRDCDKLTELDISSFDTSKVEDIYRMLYGCSSLEAIKLGAKTLLSNAELPVREWQLASLIEPPVRYHALDGYDGTNPGWYLQGYRDLEIQGITNAKYTGEAIEQTLAVSMGDQALGENVDYTVSYADNVDAGTATVTIAGMGDWVGSTTRTFIIAPKPIEPTLALSQAVFTYNGSVQTPEVVVKDGEDVLVVGADYEVAFPDGCQEVGTHPVNVTLKGNYSGSASSTFEIVTNDTQPMLTLSQAVFTYNGGVQVPEVVVRDADGALIAAKDYDLDLPQESKDVGTYTVEVALKSGYSGTGSAEFEIVAKPIEPTVVLSPSAYAYDGEAKTPAVTVKDGKEVLVADQDYSVTLPDGRADAGTYVVKVTLKGNYSGSGDGAFKIAPKVVAPTVALSQASYTYDGRAKTPAVTVRDGQAVLPAGSYAVAYGANTNAGTATVRVTLKGNYAGTGSASFSIGRAAQAISASNVAKTYGDAPFALGARRTAGDGALSYSSSNAGVAAVGADGKVIIRGAGTATVTVTAAATANYNSASKAVTVTVAKAANTVSAKGKTVTVKYSKARKKAQTVKAAKAFTVKKAKGKVTYKVAKYGKNAKKYVKVAAGGKVTVKKGARKGAYTVKVKVTAAGNANYKAKSKTVTLKVKVK